METKAIEVRDRGTFIPALAILLEGGNPAEHYLLRRSGYASSGPAQIMLVRLDADGGAHQASWDPYGWGNARTMSEAHQWLIGHWAQVEPGQVVDVEFILKETSKPKPSERES